MVDELDRVDLDQGPVASLDAATEDNADAGVYEVPVDGGRPVSYSISTRESTPP